MTRLIERLVDVLPTTIFTDTECSALLKGSPDARYGLIKRAMRKGNIIQLRRGVYAVGRRYQREPLNLFEAAQRIYSPSYVSLESALSHHGWIPEAVYTVTSVCANRSTEFDTPVGLFSYSRLAKFNFVGVERVSLGNSVALVASPTKALVDYLMVKRIDGMGLRELAASLRIDDKHLKDLSGEQLAELAAAYPGQRFRRFSRTLKGEVWL